MSRTGWTLAVAGLAVAVLVASWPRSRPVPLGAPTDDDQADADAVADTPTDARAAFFAPG